MTDLDFENPWIFTTSTVLVWILIFTAIEAVLTEGNLQSGMIKGFMGGLAYSIAYKSIQKFSE